MVRIHTLITWIQHSTGLPNQNDHAKKKRYPNQKGKSKILLFTDDKILHRKP